MTSTYDLSWSKTSFLAKLQLFLKSQQHEKQRIQSNDRHEQAEACSSLSSTYYTIAGTGFSQLKATLRPKWLIWIAPLRILLWCLTWLPLTAWCYWRMLPLSNRMVGLIGYDGMSANQCDVRQSVLRRRGQYEEAKRCIQAALAKNPENAHTRGLLRVGLAEIYRHEGDRQSVETEVKAALVEAEVSEKQDPRQAARIYKHCANLTDFVEEGDPIPGSQLRHKAEDLARSVGATDQLLKL